MSETIAQIALKTARAVAQQMDTVMANQKMLNENQQLLPKVVQSTNTALNTLQSQINSAAEVLEAVTELLGMEAVNAKVEELRAKKDQLRADEQKSQIDNGLSEGSLVTSTVVTEKSKVVFKERKPDGTETKVPRVQFDYVEMLKEHQQTLLGKGIGTVLTVDTGSTFELMEIYEPATKTEVVA
jgi:hypothetical protein